MARRDELTGKGPLSGNKRSHSLRATRRRWNVNLHTYKMPGPDGTFTTIKVSARTYRSLNKSLKEN